MAHQQAHAGWLRDHAPATMGEAETMRQLIPGIDRRQQAHAAAVVLHHLPDRGEHVPVLEMLFAPPRRDQLGPGERGEPVQRRGRAQCGTNAAYHGHRDRGEPVCEPCRDAHRAYQRDYYRTKSSR